MSLRKSPTLTPALRESNRRNAKMSTGPRTARGKAWTRLNGFRHGARSEEYLNFVEALFAAPPGRMDATAQALLASKTAVHPLFREIAEMFVQTNLDTRRQRRLKRSRGNKDFSFKAGVLLKTQGDGKGHRGRS